MRTGLAVAVMMCACGGSTKPSQSASQPPPALAPAPSSTAPADTASAPDPQPASASGSSAESAAVASSKASAERAAEAWLATADAGKYAETWADAAAPFRAALEQPKWVQMMTTARAPLGSLKSRVLKSAHYATSLPGVPDGEYVVVQFDTAFENKARAVETVTPMKEADGHFRVYGYFIR